MSQIGPVPCAYVYFSVYEVRADRMVDAFFVVSPYSAETLLAANVLYYCCTDCRRYNIRLSSPSRRNQRVRPKMDRYIPPNTNKQAQPGRAASAITITIVPHTAGELKIPKYIYTKMHPIRDVHRRDAKSYQTITYPRSIESPYQVSNKTRRATTNQSLFISGRQVPSDRKTRRPTAPHSDSTSSRRDNSSSSNNR